MRTLVALSGPFNGSDVVTSSGAMETAQLSSLPLSYLPFVCLTDCDNLNIKKNG